MDAERKPYGELSLLEFQNRFPSEESCWKYLVQMRWPKGYRCPDCPQAKVHFKPSTHTFQCYDCDRHTSATAGTLFHKSHLPLRKWFWRDTLLTFRIDRPLIIGVADRGTDRDGQHYHDWYDRNRDR